MPVQVYHICAYLSVSRLFMFLDEMVAQDIQSTLRIRCWRFTFSRDTWKKLMWIQGFNYPCVGTLKLNFASSIKMSCLLTFNLLIYLLSNVHNQSCKWGMNNLRALYYKAILWGRIIMWLLRSKYHPNLKALLALMWKWTNELDPSLVTHTILVLG